MKNGGTETLKNMLKVTELVSSRAWFQMSEPRATFLTHHASLLPRTLKTNGSAFVVFLLPSLFRKFHLLPYGTQHSIAF